MTKRVQEVVVEFYHNNQARSGNLKSVRTNERLELIHFDTVIAYMEDHNIHINSEWYSNTTSRYTNHLKRLCQKNDTSYDEFSGTLSYNVTYYEMGTILS